MATSIVDLVPMLIRELNPPGAETFPDLSGTQAMGYLADGFWDARLSGIFTGYKVMLGDEFDVPLDLGVNYITTSDEEGDFPEEYWMLIVLWAGYRLLRLKILNLAINFKAKAGPVEYEQQASATTLRAVLDSLGRRLNEFRALYSDGAFAGGFIVLDGVAQAAYAEYNNLWAFQVLR